jgi:glycine cleavage system transcriptional repressor
MQISGVVDVPVEAVDAAMAPVRSQGVDINVTAIETYIG